MILENKDGDEVTIAKVNVSVVGGRSGNQPHIEFLEARQGCGVDLYMSKDECEALISALQATCAKLASTGGAIVTATSRVRADAFGPILAPSNLSRGTQGSEHGKGLGDLPRGG